MINQEAIKETKAFIKIKDDVQKNLVLKPGSVKQIQYGVTLSKNTSYERWVEISHPTEKTKEIVKELINKNN